MALTTLADVKTHLNIPSGTTTYDTELQAFIDTACALVQAYCDKTWDSATVVEHFDGGGVGLGARVTGGQVFVLRQSPIVSLTSITVADANGTTATLASTAYQFDQDHGIIRTWQRTLQGTANVTVTYVVGGTAPALAVHAAKETVRHLWMTQRGGMGGRNPLSGEDYTMGVSFSLPRRVMELLDPLRSVY